MKLLSECGLVSLGAIIAISAIRRDFDLAWFCLAVFVVLGAVSGTFVVKSDKTTTRYGGEEKR